MPAKERQLTPQKRFGGAGTGAAGAKMIFAEAGLHGGMGAMEACRYG